VSGWSTRWTRGAGVLAALVLSAACGGSSSAPAADPVEPAPAPNVESAEERHAERTETAVFGLCSLLTRCAVLQGEAMGDQLSDEDRKALADERVLEANTTACVDEQMSRSELSPRQVAVIEGCVEQFADLTFEQCQGELFECVAKADKQD